MDGEPGRIPDDATVVRRVPPMLYPNEGEEQPKSGAFCDSSDGSDMSVDLLTGSVQDYAEANPGHAFVLLNVGDLRGIGLEVERQPVEGNENHCGVVGKKTSKVKKDIKKASKWGVAPADTQHDC